MISVFLISAAAVDFGALSRAQFDDTLDELPKKETSSAEFRKLLESDETLDAAMKPSSLQAVPHPTEQVLDDMFGRAGPFEQYQEYLPDQAWDRCIDDALRSVADTIPDDVL